MCSAPTAVLTVKGMLPWDRGEAGAVVATRCRCCGWLGGGRAEEFRMRVKHLKIH